MPYRTIKGKSRGSLSQGRQRLILIWGPFDVPQTPGILIRLAGLEASEIIRF
jgi:hypothetical protein